MHLHHPGRHRRPGPLTTASTAASTALTRSAAVAVTSTGLVAGTALAASTATGLGHEPAPAPAVSLQHLVEAGLVTVRAPAPAASLQHLIEAGPLTGRALAPDRPATPAAAPRGAVPPTYGTAGFSASTPAAVPRGAVPPTYGTAGFVASTPAVPPTGVPPVGAAPTVAPPAARSETGTAPEERTESSASRTRHRTEQPAQSAAPARPAPAAAPAGTVPAPASGGVLGIAASLTGIPYVYGGSSPSTGFDCSGYSSYVFAQAGLLLPRSAAAQQAAVTPVSDPQPGDLVFFGSPAYHVGIYAGDGMMYDAGRPGLPTQYRAVFSGVSGYGRVG